MISSILTHPGGAHKDEFLACAVLLTESAVPVVRREPTAADLENPAVAVVDVGDQHEPERNNFDHHQFSRDHNPTCALSLVLQHFGLYEDAREFCDWLETAEWFDCRGPVDTAQWLGTDRETLAKLNSPIDVTVLRRFATQNEHTPGEPIWELMRMIGEDLVGYIRELRERLDFIGRHAEIWSIPHGETEFKALYMPRTDPLPEEPSAGLGRYVERQGLENEVLALIYPDRRGQGYGLRRYNDDPHLDFTRLEAEADVHFAHARGFIAKTSATTVERLQALLVQAFVD